MGVPLCPHFFLPDLSGLPPHLAASPSEHLGVLTPSFPLAHPHPYLLSLLSPAFTLDWEAGRGLGLESPGLPPRPPFPGQAPHPVLHLLSPFLSLPIRAQWRPEESEDYVSNRCASERAGKQGQGLG